MILRGVQVAKEGVFDGLSHVKTRLLFHIVLATKYRRRCLVGLEQAVQDACEQCADVSDFDIVDLAVDNGDHLHLLVRLRKPNVSVGQVVRRIKSYTTIFLWDRCGSELRLWYTGRKRKLWSNGYFVATVGHDEKRVSNYIAKQK